MSLHDLTDDEMREFVKDPHNFLKTPHHFKRAFDLHDPKLVSRIERIQKELGPKPKQPT